MFSRFGRGLRLARATALVVGVVALVLTTGCGGSSSTIPPPDSPEIISLSAGDGSVSVEWTPVADAQYYNVYLSDVSDVVNLGTVTMGIAETFYTHDGLESGQPCYCAVTAVGEGGESLPSAVRLVYLRPDPTSILAVNPGDGTVEVLWTPVPYATTYNIYWSEDPGVTAETGTLVAGLIDDDYVHTGLTNATTYYYVVTAVGPGGESVVSAEVSVTLAPDVPSLVAVTAGDTYNDLSWSDVEGAAVYNVYLSAAPDPDVATSTLIASTEETDYRHVGLSSGTTYYYTVAAVGAGGEGKQTIQVSATPLLVPGAPINVTVTATEEVPGSLTITWDAPSTGADSYNLYWDTEPDVEIGTNGIYDVTSPYEHTGLLGRTTYYYIVTAVLDDVESDASAEVSAMPRGPRIETGGGGGHDESFGNNLSVPVVFADGHGITGQKILGSGEPWLDTATGLRPTASDTVDPFPYFDEDDAVVLNETLYYQQQGPSTWQADWSNGAGEAQGVVADWGDNLGSVTYSVNSVIRVETTLYQEDADNPMTAYVMAHLAGSGATEMWGTDTTEVESARRHVYSVCARLRIEKLLEQGGDVDTTVEGVNLPVYAGFGTDGPGAYGAEINVSGKLIYGYVWMLKQWPLAVEEKAGWWRITFSLDDTVSIGGANVENLTTLDSLDPSEGSAVLDTDNNLTYIEIEVKEKRGGGGGGPPDGVGGGPPSVAGGGGNETEASSGEGESEGDCGGAGKGNGKGPGGGGEH